MHGDFGQCLTAKNLKEQAHVHGKLLDFVSTRSETGCHSRRDVSEAAPGRRPRQWKRRRSPAGISGVVFAEWTSLPIICSFFSRFYILNGRYCPSVVCDNHSHNGEQCEHSISGLSRPFIKRGFLLEEVKFQVPRTSVFLSKRRSFLVV